MHKPILSLALLFSWPALLHAQTLADCRAIADAEQRLACYDRLPAAPLRQVVNEQDEKDRAMGAEMAKEKGTEKASVLATDAPRSLLGQAWELDASERGQILRIRQYKPVYVLPAFHASRVNHFPSSPATGHASTSSADVDATEAKYQISLKAIHPPKTVWG
jgi:phospholipase A1